MSVNIVINGVTFAYPVEGDEGWGSAATAFAVAVGSGLLQKSAGTFTLTAELDFGVSFGIKSLYYKSRTSNVASAGQIRLGNTDFIKWRNAANNADLGLQLDASNIFQLGSALTVTGALVATGTAGASNLSGTNTGDLTLATIGSTPANAGASLSGQVLTLQPADSSHGGVLDTAAQTITGVKTFTTLVGTNLQQGIDIHNLGIATSIASNALTIGLVSKNGGTITTANPVRIAFRDLTLTNGAFSTVNLTSSISITLGATDSLGLANSGSRYVWVYAINSVAGGTELAVSAHPFWDEGVIQSPTNSGSTNNNLVVGTSRTATVRLIGRIKATWSNPNWSSVTEITVGSFVRPVMAARYTSNAANNLNHATAYYIDYEDIDFDPYNCVVGAGSGVQSVTGTGFRFLAPVAGKYLVSATCSINSAGTWQAIQMSIAVNGTEKVRIHNTDSTENVTIMTAGLSQILSLALGDYVEIQEIERNSTSAAATQNGTSALNTFTIERLGF